MCITDLVGSLLVQIGSLLVQTTGGLKLCWLEQSTSLLSMSAYLRVCMVYVCLCVHVCILSCGSHMCVCHVCVTCVCDMFVFLCGILQNFDTHVQCVRVYVCMGV